MESEHDYRTRMARHAKEEKRPITYREVWETTNATRTVIEKIWVLYNERDSARMHHHYPEGVFQFITEYYEHIYCEMLRSNPNCKLTEAAERILKTKVSIDD